MILTGRSLCLPSGATVQELFSVARDASIIPDISLDPVLSTFLSLDSSAALQHQYNFLQRSMSREQQTTFNLNLTAELGASRVTCGGVGVVALALSMLFDQVAQQVRAQGSTEGPSLTQTSRPKRIFGISSSSRIGWIIHNFLCLIPGIANNQEQMAETTELYDNWLKLELLDHYERMTTKKRMSSVSMQQWLTGAAIHLHVRIHQARLQSVPLGSVNSLRISYKTGLGHLIRGYTAYLRANVQETPAPGPQKPRTSAANRPKHANTSNITKMTCSSSLLVNGSQVGPSNKSTTPSLTAGINRGCKTDESGGDFGFKLLNGSNDTTMTGDTLNTSSRYSRKEDDSMLGLLVIEPSRNVSHSIQHHPCECPAIQEALVTRIINAQDLERNRNFFQYPDRVFQSLLRQKDNFELRTN